MTDKEFKGCGCMPFMWQDQIFMRPGIEPKGCCAPALVEALEALLKAIACVNDYGFDNSRVVARAKSALAQAYGETK